MKYAEVSIFVILYIAIGFIFKLDVNQYLLIGVPLGLTFQLFIRKKSIHSAWVRTDESFVFNKIALLYSIVFSIYPTYKIIKLCSQESFTITILLYNICILVGAFAYGYALSKMTKKTAKDSLMCWLTAGFAGSAMFIALAVIQYLVKTTPIHFDIEKFFVSMLMYTPIVFIIEEVIFRGILDDHISVNDEKTNHLSMIFISCLWGWWHLPTVSGGISELLVASLVFPISHTLTGYFLSKYWRKSGNLLTPGFSHAFVDAVRNAMLK